MKKIDLTNKQFGYLTVLYELPIRRNKQIYWHCKCQCGKEIDVIGKDLKSGHTSSCGCKRKEGNKKLDLTNQKFYYLTALEPTNKRSGKCIVWKCKCDCGNITYVSTNDLRKDGTKSCGCLKSLGESKIANILEKNNIDFKRQYQIIIDNNYYYFDFAIFNNNELFYLIEYDGIQHFQTTSGGWNNDAHLQLTQKRDKIKNLWCQQHQIPLIRIPYTLGIITFSDLDIHTSNFILQEDN